MKTAPIRLPQAKAPNPDSPPSRETVLLVDDERAMRTYLYELLRKGGYQVLLASDGEEALTRSEEFEGEIHLLITDVMMPVMNGKELADRLCVLRPSIKVLFISGYGRADLWPTDTCEDQTDWLPKPFTAGMFDAKIRRILDAHP